ncbi:ribonuclease domain-containing protein [Butyrivibrio fibrisolvens]|uniref:ribonuclease domain-containing protein n=1 Tax=Butyrivibrio fibrisolvens TaxID=831 RepID=UPI00041C1D26|nr:ribonuclease domain-containing protein [Butyrivibrio fibrisolvens]
MYNLKKILSVIIILAFGLTGCKAADIKVDENSDKSAGVDVTSVAAVEGTENSTRALEYLEASDEDENVTSAGDLNQLDEDGYYYDVESVVLYLDTYDHLPGNYITKSEAKALGWEGGSVEDYMEGGAIGGDRFGNREGILPDNSYTECDIDTDGESSRGAKRLVFTDDGQYYYTEDHYDSFTEIIIVDGEIEYGEVYN